MNSRAQRETESALLDLHLGRLSPEDAAALRARIAADRDLTRADAALGAVFAALHANREVAAPADLAARCVARVRSAAGPLRLVSTAADAIDPIDGRMLLRVRSLRDVIAVAAVIVLAVGVGVPGLLQVRDRARTSACAGNMARLGQGLQAYAATFADSLPFAGWQRGASSWRPTREPGVQTQPNRRHLYVLLAQGQADPTWFVCPSSGGVPMPADQVRGRQDFLDASNVSLAFQNMAGAHPTRRAAADMPVLADDNPLFDNGRPLFELFSDPATANSRAHAGRGQNVLTLSGHVIWTTTPLCGINGDNLWTLSGVTEYTGVEGPSVETDAHLLK